MTELIDASLQKSLPKSLKKSLGSSFGMWALWDYEHFKNIKTYEDWYPVFCEDRDIEKLIPQKCFVPINLQLDGSYAFEAIVNKEPDDPRLEKYLYMRSEEYLFHSTGKCFVTGIDRIFADVDEDDVITLDLPEGDYAVSMLLINWDEDPEAFRDDGSVSAKALPDVIILIKEEKENGKTYRTDLNTFL